MTIREILPFLLIITFGFVFIVIAQLNSTPRFKQGDCAIDQLQKRTRRVTKVREFVYEYSFIDVDKVHTMRISQFDKIMRSKKCPK